MATLLPTAVDGVYGIDTSLSNYTIESENVSDIPRRETVPDQKNRTAKELLIETRHEAKLTLRGATKPTAATFTGYGGAGIKWILDSVEVVIRSNPRPFYNDEQIGCFSMMQIGLADNGRAGAIL